MISIFQAGGSLGLDRGEITFSLFLFSFDERTRLMTDYFPLGRITKRFSIEELEERKKAGIFFLESGYKD